MRQRKGLQSQFSWSLSLSPSSVFLRLYLALCRYSIHDGAVRTDEVLGRKRSNLGGCHLGQVSGDLVDAIEVAVEKHCMRQRRSPTDWNLKLVVPIGSHLGDDSIQILLAWSFVDKFLDGRVVSRQELIFRNVGRVHNEGCHQRRPIEFVRRAQRPIQTTVHRQSNLLLLD